MSRSSVPSSSSIVAMEAGCQFPWYGAAKEASTTRLAGETQGELYACKPRLHQRTGGAPSADCGLALPVPQYPNGIPGKTLAGAGEDRTAASHAIAHPLVRVAPV